MKSTLPVRGRTVAVAALAAVLLGLLLAAVDARGSTTTPTGGFSSDAPPATTMPTATASMNADRRTAVAPAGAPEEVVAPVAAANRITLKPYKWGGGHSRGATAATTAQAPSRTYCTLRACSSRQRDSGDLMSYGEHGRGAWITVYAHGAHADLTIAGLRFDTSGRGEEGPALAA